MQIAVEARYPAGVGRVAAILADQSFAELKSAIGPASAHVDITGSAEGAFTVVIRQDLPSTDIPKKFRAFVPANLDLRRVEAWEAPDATGARHGTVALEIAGAPVRLTGVMQLCPDGADGARQTWTGELRASLPLVGAALEEAAEPVIRAAIDAERSAMLARLAATP